MRVQPQINKERPVARLKRCQCRIQVVARAHLDPRTARLQARAAQLLAEETPFLMAGDYNIIPQAEDAAKPDSWREDALFRPEARAEWRKLINMGLTEAFRARTQGPGHYSFWDYQAGAWNRNNGIRIDHFLLSPVCADWLRDCQIDKDVRAGDKPSDHVPVWVDLDF